MKIEILIKLNGKTVVDFCYPESQRVVVDWTIHPICWTFAEKLFVARQIRKKPTANSKAGRMVALLKMAKEHGWSDAKGLHISDAKSWIEEMFLNNGRGEIRE